MSTSCFSSYLGVNMFPVSLSFSPVCCPLHIELEGLIEMLVI